MQKSKSNYNKRIRIVRDIIQAANLYKSRLIGRSFLYVFENNILEVRFRKRDFLHLTGVETNMTANAFYEDAVKGILRPEQFYFTSRHPYQLCSLKASQLQNLHNLVDSDVFLLGNVTTKTFTFKFGVTNLNLTLCLSENIARNGQILGSYYFPRSLQIENGFKRSENIYEVHYIFEKYVSKKGKYNKISYQDNRLKIEDLPSQLLNRIDDELI